jgi:hypothetical protein
MCVEVSGLCVSLVDYVCRSFRTMCIASRLFFYDFWALCISFQTTCVAVSGLCVSLLDYVLTVSGLCVSLLDYVLTVSGLFISLPDYMCSGFWTVYIAF